MWIMALFLLFLHELYVLANTKANGGVKHMKSNFIILLLVSLISLNISWSISATSKPEDDFYSSLSKNVNVYKEYKNATFNIRKKLDGRELKILEKELAKYSFGTLTTDYPKREVYFFASYYEDKQMIVKKYAIYDLEGNLLNSGFGRTAKKEAVLSGEFNGWKNPSGGNELADENPTD